VKGFDRGVSKSQERTRSPPRLKELQESKEVSAAVEDESHHGRVRKAKKERRPTIPLTRSAKKAKTGGSHSLAQQAGKASKTEGSNAEDGKNLSRRRKAVAKRQISFPLTRSATSGKKRSPEVLEGGSKEEASAKRLDAKDGESYRRKLRRASGKMQPSFPLTRSAKNAERRSQVLAEGPEREASDAEGSGAEERHSSGARLRRAVRRRPLSFPLIRSATKAKTRSHIGAQGSEVEWSSGEGSNGGRSGRGVREAIRKRPILLPLTRSAANSKVRLGFWEMCATGSEAFNLAAQLGRGKRRKGAQEEQKSDKEKRTAGKEGLADEKQGGEKEDAGEKEGPKRKKQTIRPSSLHVGKTSGSPDREARKTEADSGRVESPGKRGSQAAKRSQPESPKEGAERDQDCFSSVAKAEAVMRILARNYKKASLGYIRRVFRRATGWTPDEAALERRNVRPREWYR
jgi:hypothetical protein